VAVELHCSRFAQGPEAGVIHCFPADEECVETLGRFGKILEFKEIGCQTPALDLYFPHLRTAEAKLVEPLYKAMHEL
jgi:hypothetical protein